MTETKRQSGAHTYGSGRSTRKKKVSEEYHEILFCTIYIDNLLSGSCAICIYRAMFALSVVSTRPTILVYCIHCKFFHPADSFKHSTKYQRITYTYVPMAMVNVQINKPRIFFIYTARHRN